MIGHTPLFSKKQGRYGANGQADREMKPESRKSLPDDSGMIPVLYKTGTIPDLKEPLLRLVPTPVASQLTGLSTEKLREWTSRRALIPADVRPKQKGSPAKFAWQTILLLRLAALLRDQFAIELKAHKSSFDQLRKVLRSTPFFVLWGKRIALSAKGEWLILSKDSSPLEVDAFVIRLDPHLMILRDGFSLPDAMAAAGQLDLFSLPVVHGGSRATHDPKAGGRRRSA